MDAAHTAFCFLDTTPCTSTDILWCFQLYTSAIRRRSVNERMEESKSWALASKIEEVRLDLDCRQKSCRWKKSLQKKFCKKTEWSIERLKDQFIATKSSKTRQKTQGVENLNASGERRPVEEVMLRSRGRGLGKEWSERQQKGSSTTAEEMSRNGSSKKLIVIG